MSNNQTLTDTTVIENHPNPKMTNPDYGPAIQQALQDARNAHQALLDLLKPTNPHDANYGEQVQAWQNMLSLSHEWMNMVNDQVNKKWLQPWGVNTTPVDATTAEATTAGHKPGYDYTPKPSKVKPGMTKPQAEKAKREA